MGDIKQGRVKQKERLLLENVERHPGERKEKSKGNQSEREKEREREEDELKRRGGTKGVPE